MGERHAYKAAIDRLQELQPQPKYGNDNESLNVREDVMSYTKLYKLSLYDRNDFEGNTPVVTNYGRHIVNGL